MQCISDRLLLLANIICAQDRFSLISRFSSKSALLSHPFILQSNLLTYLSGSPRFPAPFTPFLSFSWQLGLKRQCTAKSKPHLLPITRRAAYPYRFFQFELQHFAVICQSLSLSQSLSVSLLRDDRDERVEALGFFFVVFFFKHITFSTAALLLWTVLWADTLLTNTQLRGKAMNQPLGSLHAVPSNYFPCFRNGK